jgi:hypothetical protein
VDQDEVTQTIRQRMAAGLLPRITAPVTAAPRRPTSPMGHINTDAAIGAVKCAACDTRGAQVAYQFPDGRIVRFHGRCHRIWEDECRRVALGIPASSAPSD